ncbi:MAG: hypothetical protein JKY15_05025, partial [Deltaproteobacteria bacterium]|nr:hypothetical protein [Deltaproteobacteria bacterium]
VAPDTHEIEDLIIKSPSFDEILRDESEIKLVPESVIDAYYAAIADRCHPGSRPGSSTGSRIKSGMTCDFPITYTPLHGVGTKYALRALKEAGFKNIQVVASQAKPDGNFPTVKFPNPEEPGALDEALKLAKETSSELILANDPDADRLAVCVNQQILSGNEIGLLLANYLLENFLPLKKGGQGGFKPLVMTTFVSSRMLSYIAVKYQVSYEETATGFANIMSRAFERERDLGEKFLFGYEEALGYCIGHQVRDKDGISALVCFANLYAKLKYENKTVFDELDRLALEYGLFTSLSWSLKGDLNNLLSKAENLPDLDKQGAKVPGMTLYTGENDLRLIVRKSGTEPKIKFYAETIAHPKNLGELQKIRQEQMAYLENLHTKIEAYVQG